jgi:hydrogenase nickel incorporation protein HypA/HybF
MHELALMEGVVEVVIQRVPGERVVTVRLEIGALAGVVIDSLKFCFEVCARGTALDGAVLEVDVIPALARCRTCGTEAPIGGWAAACPCGSFDREIIAGDELRLKSVEVV